MYFFLLLLYSFRYGPHFETGNVTNITVQVGNTFYLHCRISLLQDKTVSCQVVVHLFYIISIAKYALPFFFYYYYRCPGYVGKTVKMA